MPLAIRSDCPGCQHFERTGDFFHDKETWDRYHNAGWTNGISDWKPIEEIQESLDKLKEVWLKVQKMKENLPNNHIPEWKIKKIMSKR